MAQLKRSEIIDHGKVYAGRKGENLDLVALIKAFDFITKNLTEEYHLLPTTKTGSLVTLTNYIPLPSDFESPRLIEVAEDIFSSLKIDGNWVDSVDDSEAFLYHNLADQGNPTAYTIEQSPSINRILLHPTPILTPAYEFYYFKLHPKSWITWAGLATKTDISFTASTKTIAQVAAGFDVEACAAGRKLIVSGSASNDGTYTIVSATTAAVVVAEALTDEAAGATVTITVESADDYLHEYGERWDDVVIQGVAWRVGIIVKERAVTEARLAEYQALAAQMAEKLTRSPRPGQVRGFYF